MNICEYGCGQEALYQFKNGKWCCNKYLSQCPTMKKKNSNVNLGKLYIKTYKPQPLNDEIKKLCDYGCGQEALFQFKNGKVCCSKHFSECPNYREKSRVAHIGEKNHMFGKKQSKETIEKKRLKTSGEKHPLFNKKHSKKSIEKMSLNSRLTIERINKRYPLFSKIEEMRYNPDKPMEEKEIQVHCKNSNCENSKEKGGWFTPSKSQIHERMRQTDSYNGQGGCYIYCSQHCKYTCPIYGLRDDPFKNINKPFRSQVWNEQVLKQDDYTCQICGIKENLHCHHIEPVKLEPELSLDPSNGIVLCQTCHIKYGHKKGTECSLSSLAKLVCKKKETTNEIKTS